MNCEDVERMLLLKEPLPEKTVTESRRTEPDLGQS